MNCRKCHAPLLFYRSLPSASGSGRQIRVEAAHNTADEGLPAMAANVTALAGNTTKKEARRRLEETCTRQPITDKGGSHG